MSATDALESPGKWTQLSLKQNYNLSMKKSHYNYRCAEYFLNYVGTFSKNNYIYCITTTTAISQTIGMKNAEQSYFFATLQNEMSFCNNN